MGPATLARNAHLGGFARMGWRDRRILVPLGVLVAAGVAVVLFNLASGRPQELIHAEQAIAKREFQAAGEHLDKYLARHPDDIDARVLAAQVARRREDYDAAATHLRKCSLTPGQNPKLDLERRLRVAQE